jgi:ketosteroid isomerase-like protein
MDVMKHVRMGFLSLVVLSLLSFGCSSKMPQTTNVRQEVQAIMNTQSQAWNKGDLHAFMEPYWHSDSLVFLGKNGPTYGWDKTLQNYQKSYATPEAMGKLTFTLLQVNPLAADVLFVVGKWHLTRSIGNVEGHFSLVFRKIAGKWKIVADHSS